LDFFSDFSPFLLLLIISVITLTPEPMLHLNVCLLGWVIDSNMLFSVSLVPVPTDSSGTGHRLEPLLISVTCQKPCCLPHPPRLFPILFLPIFIPPSSCDNSNPQL
jgi:hypothetical protein